MPQADYLTYALCLSALLMYCLQFNQSTCFFQQIFHLPGTSTS
jgi:hypothetical protein